MTLWGVFVQVGGIWAGSERKELRSKGVGAGSEVESA